MIKFTEDNTQENDFRVLRPKDQEGAEGGGACGAEAGGAGRGAAQGAGAGAAGGPQPEAERRARLAKRKALGWAAASVVAALVLATTLLLVHWHNNIVEGDGEYLYEPVAAGDIAAAGAGTIDPISKADTTITWGYTELASRTVNDIELEIYIPHNASAELMIGTPDINDKSIIFATQAADIRADNGKIVGAFVLKGQPVAWGLSKKGYCSIIDDEITVGVADNSPLFEEATERGGYFFRQYPLVSNGTLVENEPKGKSIRKAICARGDEILVIMTATPESFHDFSQALIDLGCSNAVYLVGSEYSYGFTRAEDGSATAFALKRRTSHKYDNYLIWRTN